MYVVHVIRVSAEHGKALNSIFKIPALEKPGKKIVDKKSGKAWSFLWPDKKENNSYDLGIFNFFT